MVNSVTHKWTKKPPPVNFSTPSAQPKSGTIGLHHGGLDGSADKFEALKSLAELSRQPDFSSRQITLDGFILANTPVAQIPDAGGRDWPALERDLPLMRQEGDYAGKLLTRPEEAR